MNKIVIISLWILSCSMHTLIAQWQSPEALYNAQCLVSSSGSILVGTNGGGIFVSNDSGSTWMPKNEGLPVRDNGWIYSVKCLAIHQNEIYAGLESKGIYVSKDQGGSWVGIHTGLPDTCSVYSLVTLANLLFAGTDKGVFESSDRGDNWEEKNNGLTTVQVNDLSTRGDHLFAGTQGGGMFFSGNSGEDWSSINSGLLDLNVSSVVSGTSKLIIGTQNGIFSSDDNGSTWISSSNGIDNQDVSYLGNNGTTLFALAGDSIYRSTDEANEWTLVNDPIWEFQLKHNRDISTMGISDSFVFLFTGDAKVFRTIDNGDNWDALTVDADIRKLACSGNLIYAITGSSGVYVSKDSGISWNSINRGLGAPIHGRNILMDGSNVFACTLNGIYLSENEGEHWERISDFRADFITISGTNIFAGYSYRGIYLSTDYGKTWDLVSTKGFECIASEGDIIYGGTAGWDRGLFVSKDSARTWEKIFSGSGSDVVGIEIDGDTIFVGTWYDGIFRSVDKGESWVHVDNQINYIPTIKKEGNLIVAHKGYISTDNGNEWKELFGAPGISEIDITEEFIYGAGYDKVHRLPIPVLLVNDHSISFYDPNLPGSETIEIVSTTDWTITKSADWLSCSHYSGSGHATVTISDSINLTPATRTDTLIISGADVNAQKVVVRHYGQYLEISDDSLTIESKVDSTHFFDIYSSTNWSAISNQSWLSLSKEEVSFTDTLSGTGNDRIRLLAESNPSSQQRIAWVIVSAKNFEDKLLTVIQNEGVLNSAPSFIGGESITIEEDAGPQIIENWAREISAGSENESDQLLTFHVTSDNVSLFSALPAISSKGTLTFSAAENAHGLANVSVILRDDGGTLNGGIDSSDSRALIITVNPVNDAPEVLVPFEDVEITSGFLREKISLLGIFTDPDEDDLQLTASSSNEGVVLISLEMDSLILMETGTGITTVTVTADDGEYEVSDDFKVSVEEAVSIHDKQSNESIGVRIYPNPTKGKFFITGNTRTNLPAVIKVVNTNGQIVLEKRSYPKNGNYTEAIDISNMSSGVYTILILDDGKLTTLTLLKHSSELE